MGEGRGLMLLCSNTGEWVEAGPNEWGAGPNAEGSNADVSEQLQRNTVGFCSAWWAKFRVSL